MHDPADKKRHPNRHAVVCIIHPRRQMAEGLAERPVTAADECSGLFCVNEFYCIGQVFIKGSEVKRSPAGDCVGAGACHAEILARRMSGCIKPGLSRPERGLAKPVIPALRLPS
jgi:hypothetical protein